MIRNVACFPSLLVTLVLAGAARSQVVLTTDDASDRVIAFSPVDGSVVSENMFSIPNSPQVTALDVNGQIWVSEQNGDRVTRYDSVGNVLGQMGPTLPGGGMDNIRGMTLINGIVYVTNSQSGNGATANSLVRFDTAGNYLGTIALTNTTSPFTVIPFQGDMLVIGSSANDYVHRYTLTGTSLGTFYNPTGITFMHAGCMASDGNVWVSTFTGDTILKLDATNGSNVLQTIPSDNARGIFELQNGNLMWTNTSGTWVYDMTTNVSTLVRAGSNYNLFLGLDAHSYHMRHGTGCHVNQSSVFQFFADLPAAKAALDGNAMHFVRTASGYVASWVPGAAAGLYVTPSGGAPIIANGDSTTTTITPSAPIPIPGGTTATWTVSSNGILTAGSTGNQTTSGTPTLASTATATGLAFYTWANHNPAEASSGKVKWEEASGVLYVTFDGVEYNGGTPTLAPSTFQFQVNMATGDVTMLWTSFSASNSTSDVLVGCTLVGAGSTPVSQSLSTTSNYPLTPDGTLTPMTLTAAPAPIINPSTLVTYTIGNAPEIAPGSGLYLSTLFLSINPVPGGIDLTGILTPIPGCKLYIATLDVNIGTAVTVTPTNTTTLTFATPVFAPGNLIGAQAVGFFDAGFPLINGESSGFLFSNGVMSVTRVQ